MNRILFVKTTAVALALGTSLWLGGCASTDSAPAAAHRPDSAAAGDVSPAVEQRAQAALAEAQKQFAAGAFGAVILGLSMDKDIEASSNATRVQAHKLLAFSYCMAGKTMLCHTEVARVMVLDPGFRLPEAERSHPMWGPAFETARTKAALPFAAPAKL